MCKISRNRKTPKSRKQKTENGLISAFLCFCVSAGGCGEKQQQAEIISLEGKVEKIERTSDTTGKIKVAFFSEKQKQEITGIAQVTKETEIMIDGAAATFKDLREGERIRGEVRVDKKGEKKVQTVLKIHVERPKIGG
ncbi:MAG: hypothetical protein ACREH5_08120 [Candidatus Omnitrophota bacterium]